MSRASGVLTLTVTSPVQTFTELLTAAEVKEWLKISDPSPADSVFDDELTLMIQAAREKCEQYQGRDLVSKQWDLTLDYFRATQIELREPLVSVDLVQYKDSGGTTTALTANTGYIVDTPRSLIQPPYGESWPSFTAWPSSGVTIRFTSGAAPAHVQLLKIAMLHAIEYWFSGKGGTEWIPFGSTVSPAIERMMRYGAKESVY